MVELTRGKALLISAAGVNSPESAEICPAPVPLIFRTILKGLDEGSCSDSMIFYSVL